MATVMRERNPDILRRRGGIDGRSRFGVARRQKKDRGGGGMAAARASAGAGDDAKQQAEEVKAALLAARALRALFVQRVQTLEAAAAADPDIGDESDSDMDVVALNPLVDGADAMDGLAEPRADGVDSPAAPVGDPLLDTDDIEAAPTTPRPAELAEQEIKAMLDIVTVHVLVKALCTGRRFQEATFVMSLAPLPEAHADVGPSDGAPQHMRLLVDFVHACIRVVLDEGAEAAFQRDDTRGGDSGDGGMDADRAAVVEELRKRASLVCDTYRRLRNAGVAPYHHARQAIGHVAKQMGDTDAMWLLVQDIDAAPTNKPPLGLLVTIMNWLAQAREAERTRAAFDLYGRLGGVHNTRTYGALLRACRHGLNPGEDALAVAADMEASGVAMDRTCVSALLNALAEAGDSAGARSVLAKFEADAKASASAGASSVAGDVGAAVAGAPDPDAGKKPNVRRRHAGKRDAAAFLDSIVLRNVVVKACARGGDAETALEVLDEAVAAGLVPTGVTFASTIQACCSGAGRAARRGATLSKHAAAAAGTSAEPSASAASTTDMPDAMSTEAAATSGARAGATTDSSVLPDGSSASASSGSSSSSKYADTAMATTAALAHLRQAVDLLDRMKASGLALTTAVLSIVLHGVVDVALALGQCDVDASVAAFGMLRREVLPRMRSSGVALRQKDVGSAVNHLATKQQLLMAAELIRTAKLCGTQLDTRMITSLVHAAHHWDSVAAAEMHSGYIVRDDGEALGPLAETLFRLGDDGERAAGAGTSAASGAGHDTAKAAASPSSASASRSQRTIQVLRAIHAEMAEHKIRPDVHYFNAVANLLVTRGMTAEALAIQSVMRKTPGCEPDATTFNTLMKAPARAGNVDAVRELAAQMLRAGAEPDARSMSMLMLAVIKSGDPRAAISIMRSVRESGAAPDERLYNVFVRGCADHGMAGAALNVWRDARPSGDDGGDGDGDGAGDGGGGGGAAPVMHLRFDATRALIRACVNAGRYDDAAEVLYTEYPRLAPRLVIHKRALLPLEMVRAYAKAGDMENATAWVRRMGTEFDVGNSAAAHSVLLAGHFGVGDVGAALELYRSAFVDGDVPAQSATTTTLLRGLAAARRTGEALALLRQWESDGLPAPGAAPYVSALIELLRAVEAADEGAGGSAAQRDVELVERWMERVGAHEPRGSA